MKTILIILALVGLASGATVPDVESPIDDGQDTVDENAANNGKFLCEIQVGRLWLFYYHHCNGAYIDPDFVLVPASCVNSKPWFSSFKIIVGSAARWAKNITIHEEYDGKSKNDIAVIQLSSAVDYTETTPIVLPSFNQSYTVPGTAQLYKRDSSGEIQISDIALQKVTVCSEKPVAVGTEHICAGDQEKSAVKGDEGSILAVTDGVGQKVVIGLVSYVEEKSAPAVFTRISYYSNWIVETMFSAW